MKNTEKIKNMNRKIYLGVVVIAVIFLMSGNVSATTIEVTDETTGSEMINKEEIPTYKVNVYDSNNLLIGTYNVTRDVFNHALAVPGDPCNLLPEPDRYDEYHECPPTTIVDHFHGSKNSGGEPTHSDWIEIGSASGSSTINSADNPSEDKRTGINFHPLETCSLGCMGIVSNYDDFRNKVNDNGDLDNEKVKVKIKDRYTQTGDGIKRCCTTSEGKSGTQTCSGGSWGTCGACLKDQWCEEGECVPEASTLVVIAVGLLFLAGYVRLLRRKPK